MQLKNIRLQKYSAAVFTAVAGLVLLYVFLPPAAVWITDNGNKYIIARNFAETGSVAIEHPCKDLFPCGGFHFVRMADGSIRSFHSEVFPVLTSFIRRFAGDTAMALPALAATVILLILIIGGFIMLSLGVIGHYIARIYEEVKGRPKYIISDVTENVMGEVTGSWKR